MANTAHKKRNKRKKLTSEELRTKLKLKHFQARKKLSEKHPKVEKFFKNRGIDPGKIREHSAKLIGAGAITGALLLSPPVGAKILPNSHDIVERLKTSEDINFENPQELLAQSLKVLLPKDPRQLYRNEEKILEQMFEDFLDVKARATLEGEHLNTGYGYIGVEQHLRRYPGDTLLLHGSGDIIKEGLASGLSAWGYFANSKDEMTSELVGVERWYAVVQTLYLPDWNSRQPYLKNWYKYRKVLIVNTENGKAVVASISDSGPAAWTGKHFGGSPEVMDYLGGSRYKKGPVIVFFVDDPENKVPLGPVEYSSKKSQNTQY